MLSDGKSQKEGLGERIGQTRSPIVSAMVVRLLLIFGSEFSLFFERFRTVLPIEPTLFMVLACRLTRTRGRGWAWSWPLTPGRNMEAEYTRTL